MSTLKTGKVKTTTIADELDTESTAVTNVINGSAKAWVNWHGTGTVAIRASHNVTSITDNTTGDYTVNFATAFADRNYAMASHSSRGSGGEMPLLYSKGTDAAGSINIKCGYTWSVAYIDPEVASVVFFR